MHFGDGSISTADAHGVIDGLHRGRLQRRRDVHSEQQNGAPKQDAPADSRYAKLQQGNKPEQSEGFAGLRTGRRKKVSGIDLNVQHFFSKRADAGSS
jgi:hypothetical protein